MKFQKEKDEDCYQTLLDKDLQMKSELKQLEGKIEQFQKQYLQNTWNDGNISVGWSKVNSPAPPVNAPKIQLAGKDKIFSLSSTTSNANLSLRQIADKNLTPLPENKFQQSKKQLERKKNRNIEEKRKFIRRRRR